MAHVQNLLARAEPNLQGDYFDTVVLQGDEVARRVARHTISPLIAHRLGYEWTAGDWGTPHPTPALDSHMIKAGSFCTISFRAVNDLLLFAANNPAAAPPRCRAGELRTTSPSG